MISLVDFAARPPSAPILIHDLVLLRPPLLDDCDPWVDLREASREHLTRWEPAWRAGDLNARAFTSRMKTNWRDLRRGVGLPLLVFKRADERLVGGVTLSNIRYGASRSAVIGYWIGAPYLRQGYAKAAIAAVLAHGFQTLKLNRIEAACQPGNTASRQLLAGAGFAEEGLARSYLRINGRWRDHVLLAATASDFKSRLAGAAGRSASG